MEQQYDLSGHEEPGLFSLSIDPVVKGHLSDTARWAKFLSIIGFVFCGLMLIGAIFGVTTGSMYASRYGEYEGNRMMAMGSAVGTFIFILVALVYFFPLLFLFRFSSRMKTALQANDQQALDDSFRNLKAMFRFIGVLTIIILAIWLLLIVIGVLGAAAMRG